MWIVDESGFPFLSYDLSLFIHSWLILQRQFQSWSSYNSFFRFGRWYCSLVLPTELSVLDLRVVSSLAVLVKRDFHWMIRFLLWTLLSWYYCVCTEYVILQWRWHSFLCIIKGFAFIEDKIIIALNFAFFFVDDFVFLFDLYFNH